MKKQNIYLYSADNDQSYEDYSEVSFIVTGETDEEALAAGKRELERRRIASDYFNPIVQLYYRDVRLSDQINYSIINETARELAFKAHAGQFRRDGKTPYFNHVTAVAEALPGHLEAAGYLHDTLEDTKITAMDLEAAGIPTNIIDIVKILTHSKGETNEIYWERVLTSPDALLVKLADINHNLSDKPTDKQRTKYKKALTLFARASLAAQEILNRFF